MSNLDDTGPQQTSKEHFTGLFVSLREHLEALIREKERRYNERFDAQQRALDIAAGTAITRTEFNVVKSHLDKIEAGGAGRDKGFSVAWAVVVVVVGVFFSLAHYMRG